MLFELAGGVTVELTELQYRMLVLASQAVLAIAPDGVQDARRLDNLGLGHLAWDEFKLQHQFYINYAGTRLAAMKPAKEVTTIYREPPAEEPSAPDGSIRYFLDRDNSGHWYLVESARREQWEMWCNFDEDNPAAWEAPPFARRIGGAPARVSFLLPVEEQS